MHVHIRSLRESLEHARSVVRKIQHKEHVEPYEGTGFRDLESMRTFLTSKRLDILKAVRAEKPESVYALAQLLDRDLKSVNRDIEKLADHGMIELRKEKKGRGRVAPYVWYDKIVMDISLR